MLPSLKAQIIEMYKFKKIFIKLCIFEYVEAIFIVTIANVNTNNCVTFHEENISTE